MKPSSIAKLATLAAVAAGGAAFGSILVHDEAPAEAGTGGFACMTNDHNISWSVTPYVSTGYANVTCSGVRISTSEPRRIYVDFKDASTTDTFGCQLLVMSWNGSSVVYSESHYSPIGGPTNYGPQIYTIPTNVVGYISLTCHIPENSWLAGFNIQ